MRKLVSMLISRRGIPLAWSCGESRTQTVVTVELWPKWYGLQLVHPDDTVEEVLFPYDPTPTSRVPYHDHVPNAHVVQDWAFQQKYWLDELAYELLLGRWAEFERPT